MYHFSFAVSYVHTLFNGTPTCITALHKKLKKYTRCQKITFLIFLVVLFGLYFLSSNLDRITSLVLFWICLCLWLLQNNNFSDFGCRFYPMFWYSTTKNNKTNGIINFLVADIKLLLQWWLVVKYIAFSLSRLIMGVGIFFIEIVIFAAFVPARQLWEWSGKSTKRPGMKGKAKKEFYRSIIRGKEHISVSHCKPFTKAEHTVFNVFVKWHIILYLLKFSSKNWDIAWKFGR